MNKPGKSISRDGELSLGLTWLHKNALSTPVQFPLYTVLLVREGAGVLLNYFHPLFGLAGSVLVLIMSVGTLSFLITTPETWVPSLGGADHGFPFLSGKGRLVIKDVIMMAAAFVALTDSAKVFLRRSGQL